MSDNINVRDMVNDYMMERLRNIEVLPTFPHIAGQMIRAIEDPASSASDLARHMDPSMVGEVLRIANAAYYGTGNFRTIASLEHAIAVIGFRQLLSIILHMPFITMAREEEGAFDRGLFIRHSMTVGVLSRAISLRTGAGDPNEVYLGGIMHDVGAIIIYRYFRDEWQAIDRLITGSAMLRVEAERAVLACDHGRIGAALLDLWNFPKPVTDCVRFHHGPDTVVENGEHVTIVRLANDLAKSISLARDLTGFDEFAVRHRTSVASATETMGKEITPSEEVAFLENIYLLLKETRDYVNGITEGDDDKDSCS